MKELGVALGGGGLKGLAHIGILQVLQENKIPIRQISGTSIGGIIASLYATGMSPYQMEKIALNLNTSEYIDYNLTGILKYISSLYIPGVNIPFNGFIKGDKLEKLMCKLTRNRTLEDVKIPLAIISCDIDTGKEVVFSNRDLDLTDTQILIKEAKLSQATRASSSIPVTFVPYKYDHMQLVDGGIREIVPVRAPLLMGADYVLAVNLGQEVYKEKVKGILQIINRTLSILIFETSKESQEILADMVIFPGITGVDITDVKKAGEIIRAGRRAMKQKIAELKEALQG